MHRSSAAVTLNNVGYVDFCFDGFLIGVEMQYRPFLGVGVLTQEKVIGVQFLTYLRQKGLQLRKWLGF
jgi:hypothetical protein